MPYTGKEDGTWKIEDFQNKWILNINYIIELQFQG